jgi:hypothetical protein
MRVPVVALSVSLFVVAMAGFAAEPVAPTASPDTSSAPAPPSAPVPPQAPTAAAPPDQAPAAATTAQAPTEPTAAAAKDAAALAQSAHELGYTKKLLDGKTVYYCKADATLGTRLASTKCYTEDQMTAVVQRAIANRQSVAELEHKNMNQPGGT